LLWWCVIISDPSTAALSTSNLARIIFDLVFAGELDVAAMSHPSLLAIEDLEKYATSAKVPLLINACEVDHQFPKEKQEKALELFKDFTPGFSQPYFDGCVHGFAVRGDMVRFDDHGR
jgi:dienelactone hydrolase